MSDAESRSDSDSNHNEHSSASSSSDSDSGSQSGSSSQSSSSGSESESEKTSTPAKSEGGVAEDMDMDVNVENSDSHETSDHAGRGSTRVVAIKEIVRTAKVIRKVGRAQLPGQAAEQPDLYGIRRSARARKEVARYTAGKDSDSDEHPTHRRGNSRQSTRGKRKTSNDWDENGSSSRDSDESQDYKPKAARGRRVPAPRKTTRKPARKTVIRTSTRSTRNRHLSDSSSSSGSSSGSSSDDSSGDDSDEKPSRISKRGSGPKKISYKENSETATESDDLIEYDTTAAPAEINNSETIEKVLKIRKGRVGATGSKTTFYNVQDNGDPNVTEEIDNEVALEVQYQIKWKHWSHIHNTWESESTLKEQKVNGMKKLENFVKKEDELQEWRDLATPEDIEYFNCQQEMMLDLLLSYRNVERIITHKANETSSLPDYFVKWTGLPYADCTWEDGEIIVHRFADAIEEYNLRNKSQRIPTKICRALKQRPKFTPFKDQPSFVGESSDSLQLRDYQLAGLNWLLHSWTRNNSAILADEMGLGKTIETIAFLTTLMHNYHLYGPFLLVVPLSTLVTWQREFKIWAPEVNVVVYIGDISSRSIIRDYEWCHSGNKRLKFNVLVTTYEILLKDKTFLANVSWAVLGVDEAHRLKNDDSLLYKTLFTFDTNHRLLITGTPLQNSLKELWALLQFIMPHKFGDWDDFESLHSQADKTGFVKLHKELEPYLLRRVKKDVEKSLPAKTERILRVEMSKRQRKYYRLILTKNFKALTRGLKGSLSSFLNIVMELKKCCNHSHLIRPPEDDEKGRDDLETLIKGSGKLILLDKLLLRLQESGHRVLIFSQMVRMLDILAEYLQWRRFPYQRLDGSIRGELRKQAMDHFNAEGSNDFCFLLSTRAGGLGVNLATADTVIIFDSDWNPQNDLQAQARAHRIGQKKQVSVYRLVTKSSIEEDIVERAKKKMVLDHLIIQRMDTTGRTVLNRGVVGGSQGGNNPFNKDELNAILKFGAEELFKEESLEDEDEQVDIDEILKRAETRTADEDTNSMSDDLLSQFKVVSFDNLEDEEIERTTTSGGALQRAWEDIIPEEDRKKIEEDEIQQQLMELNLPPRARKQVKQIHFDSDEEYTGRKTKKGNDEDSFSSEDDSDEDRPKRKGRGKATGKDSIKGFTNAEIRRFIKSYKKFGQPLDRIDSIAGDSELQEKSIADLRRLAEMLHNQCYQAMQEHEEKLKEELPAAEGARKGNRGPSFKLAGVTVNAKSVFQSTLELDPLATVVPAKKDDRQQYKLEFHTKNAHFDCPWDVEEDSHLLWGVYEYGMGNWEAIKMDPDFDLRDKILPDGDLKPQAKHLQTRTDYLLKALAKHLGRADTTAPKKERKKKAAAAKKEKAESALKAVKNAKFKSKEIIDDADSEDSGREHKAMEDSKESIDGQGSIPSSPKKKKKKKEKKEKKEKKIEKEEKEQIEEEEEEGEVRDKKKDKRKKKSKKTASTGPVHITMGATQLITGQGEIPTELPDEVFAQCKEKMRPVKKSLLALDSQSSELSEKDQLVNTRRCLLKIGDHIHNCLNGFNDPDIIKHWRSFLWMFVSKFTPFDARKLHKLYKYAVKKREDLKEKDKSQTSTDMHYSHSHSHGHHHSNKRSHGEHPPNHHRPEKHKHQSGPSKRMHPAPPENWSDNSREELTGQNRHHGNNQSGPGFGNSSYGGRANQEWESNQDLSSAERWKLASPLARPDDGNRKRFGNSFSSYNRPPNQRYHPGEKPYHGNKGFHGEGSQGFHREKERFNNDRREHTGAHYTHENTGYTSNYTRFDPRSCSGDPRSCSGDPRSGAGDPRSGAGDPRSGAGDPRSGAGEGHQSYRTADFRQQQDNEFFSSRGEDREDRHFGAYKRKPVEHDRMGPGGDRRGPKEPKYGSPDDEDISEEHQGSRIPTVMTSDMSDPLVKQRYMQQQQH